MTSNEEMRRLSKVAVLAEDVRNSRDSLMAEAIARVKAELASKQHALDEAVMDALKYHSVTDVARAYTPPGSTPNRARIYEIRKRFAGPEVEQHGEYPFRWVPRVINTVHGEITVYDMVAILTDFGPEDINGEFRWTYIGGELEPVIDPTAEPYPTTKAYQSMLQQWLMRNPYPEED